jgi:hypothetical protein
LRPLHFAGLVQEKLDKLMVEAKPKKAREPRLKDAEANLNKLPVWNRKAFDSYRSLDYHSDSDDDDDDQE